VSYTYLYLLSRDTIAATARRIQSFRTSRSEFDGFLKGWGNYTHEAFLRDLADQRPHGKEIYYLAHTLVVNRPDVESVGMHVELHLLFLDCYWLERPAEGAPLEVDVRGFLEAKKTAGFRIRWGASTVRDRAILELMGDIPPAIKTKMRSRKGIYTEENLAEVLAAKDLSLTFVRDALLINRLCNHQRPPEPTAAGYPIWIVAGWDNYQGHLTGAELRSLAPLDQPDGFLSLFKRAVDSGPQEPRWQNEVLERLNEVREKAIALGDDSLCIAISSL